MVMVLVMVMVMMMMTMAPFPPRAGNVFRTPPLGFSTPNIITSLHIDFPLFLLVSVKLLWYWLYPHFQQNYQWINFIRQNLLIITSLYIDFLLFLAKNISERMLCIRKVCFYSQYFNCSKKKDFFSPSPYSQRLYPMVIGHWFVLAAFPDYKLKTRIWWNLFFLL